MNIQYYPNEETVRQAIQNDVPLLMMISYNGDNIIASCVEDSFEHHILLKQVERNETEIDQYFRIVVDKSGADWTFACPATYKNISDKHYRIRQFYKDGFTIIPSILLEMGYLVGINIPTRYRRHFNMLSE